MVVYYHDDRIAVGWRYINSFGEHWCTRSQFQLEFGVERVSYLQLLSIFSAEKYNERFEGMDKFRFLSLFEEQSAKKCCANNYYISNVYFTGKQLQPRRQSPNLAFRKYIKVENI